MERKHVARIALLLLVLVGIISSFFILNKTKIKQFLPSNETPLPTSLMPNDNWNINKRYFYYYFDEKIPIQFVEMNGSFPSFMVQNASKAIVLLTDEFIVTIKPGTSQEDLETLNSKYDVSIVKKMLIADTFILTAKNNPNINALDMANFYHNQPIIKSSAPNFGQLSTGPN